MQPPPWTDADTLELAQRLAGSLGDLDVASDLDLVETALDLGYPYETVARLVQNGELLACWYSSRSF